LERSDPKWKLALRDGNKKRIVTMGTRLRRDSSWLQ
jgi:hypothetical protein